MNTNNNLRIWREENDLIYLSPAAVASVTKPEFEQFSLCSQIGQFFCRSSFEPTEKEVVIIKGTFFEDSYRRTAKVRDEADKRNLSKPNPWLALIIRSILSNQDIALMNLRSIIVMSDPLMDDNQCINQTSHLLGVSRHRYDYDLGTYHNYPNKEWGPMVGFAFVS